MTPPADEAAGYRRRPRDSRLSGEGAGESGYTVDRTGDGREGLFLAISGSYDAIVLDRMLPGMDGLALLGALRGAHIQTPALILSALGSVDDRVKGLRSGGDDYLVKPFAFSELLARIEVLLQARRRCAEPDPASASPISNSTC